MAGAFKKYYLMNAFPTQGMHENTTGIYGIGVLTASGVSNFYRLETTSLYPRIEYLIDTSQPVYANVPSTYMKVNGFIQEYILCGGKDSIQECPTVYTSRDGVKLYLLVVYFDFQYDMESYTINPDYFPYLIRDITDTSDETITRWMIANLNAAASGAALFISTINYTEPDPTGNFDLTETMLADILAITLSGKLSTVPLATLGNFAAFDGSGKVVDSLLNASSFATAAQGTTAESAYDLANSLSSAIDNLEVSLSGDIQAETLRATTEENSIRTVISNLTAYNIGFNSVEFPTSETVEDALFRLMNTKANKEVRPGTAYFYDFNFSSMGTGYSTGDRIDFVELPNTFYSVESIDSSGVITGGSFNREYGNTNYTGNLTSSGGSGTGFSLTVTSYIARNIVTIINEGNNYTVGDVLAISGASPLISVTITETDANGGIVDYTVEPKFANTIQTIPSALLSGGTGNGGSVEVSYLQQDNYMDLQDVDDKLTALIAKNAADISALKGSGGPLPATDLGVSPTQENITEYAMYAIFDDSTGAHGTFSWNSNNPSASTYIATGTGLTHTAAEIFNSTWIRNTTTEPNPHFRGNVADAAEMNAISSPAANDFCNRLDTGTEWEYDGTAWANTSKLAGTTPHGTPNAQTHHVWSIVNTPTTTPAVFEWVDIGTVGTNIATESVSGVVTSSSAPGEVRVNPVTGKMTMNGTSPLVTAPFFTASNYIEAMTIYESNPISLIFFL